MQTELTPKEVKLVVSALEAQARMDDHYAEVTEVGAICQHYTRRSISGRLLAQKLLAELGWLRISSRAMGPNACAALSR